MMRRGALLLRTSASASATASASISRALSTAAASSPSLSPSPSPAASQHVLELLYDSDCPLCRHEIEFLQSRDRQQRIKFTDISSPLYSAQEHCGVDYEQGMKRLTAILPPPEDRIITGMEVIRKTYQTVGLGWLFAVSELPVVGGVFDKLYDVWAEYRLPLTGRHSLSEVLAIRESKKKMKMQETQGRMCNGDQCAVHQR